MLFLGSTVSLGNIEECSNLGWAETTVRIISTIVDTFRVWSIFWEENRKSPILCAESISHKSWPVLTLLKLFELYFLLKTKLIGLLKQKRTVFVLDRWIQHHPLKKSFKNPKIETESSLLGNNPIYSLCHFLYCECYVLLVQVRISC